MCRACTPVCPSAADHAPCLSVSSHGHPARQQRKFTRWAAAETDAVLTYFDDWISGVRDRGLPGKADILQFKRDNPSVSHDWTTVRNKVLNERMAFAKRKKLRLNSLSY